MDETLQFLIRKRVDIFHVSVIEQLFLDHADTFGSADSYLVCTSLIETILPRYLESQCWVDIATTICEAVPVTLNIKIV